MTFSKIQRDFLGLWVNVGYITRPTEPSQFKVGDRVKVYHFGGSTRAGVGKNATCKRGQYLEYWTTTGMHSQQLPALRKKLSQKDLERYIRNEWQFYQNKTFDQKLLFEFCDIQKVTW